MTAKLIERTRGEVQPGRIGRAGSFARVAQHVGNGDKLQPKDWLAIGKDYLHFSQSFPGILKTLIDRLVAPEHESIRTHLEKIYQEEIGAMSKGVPHTEMFKTFMNATGVDAAWEDAPLAPLTEELVSTLRELYATGSVEQALGAQTAFELIGEEIIRNFSSIAFRGSDVAGPDLRYFDVHLVGEREHVDFMGLIADILDTASQDVRSHEAFLHGAIKAAEALKRFWANLWSDVFAKDREGKLLFLSWSGLAAASVAQEVRRVLVARFSPLIQESDIFFSDTDIHSGTRWADAIDEHVADATASLVVLSPTSVTSAWVNFEAGALFQRQSVGTRGRMHVLVLGSNPDRFVDRHHPLSRIQSVNARDAQSFVKEIVEEAERRRPLLSAFNTTSRIKEAASDLAPIVEKWGTEADREFERRPENAVRWLEYLLSLTGRRPSRAPIPDAPTSLLKWNDVENALRLVIQRFLGSRIPPGKRVYLATRLSEIAREKTDDRYLYRLLYSAAGLDAEGTWRQHSLVGRESNIHRCFETQSPQPQDNDLGAEVPGEKAVRCRPVTLDGVVLCVVGLSSQEGDPTGRMADLAAEFEGVLQWFFSIVSTQRHRLHLGEDSASDGEVARAIEEKLRTVEEYAGFDSTKKRPRPECEITSSVLEPAKATPGTP